MKRYLILFLFYQIFTTTQIKCQIKLDIEVDKDSYLVHEPITLLIKLTNTDYNDLNIIGLRLNIGFELIVIDQNGNRINDFLKETTFTKVDKKRVDYLKNGEFRYMTYPLLPFGYINHYEYSETGLSFGYLVPGQYSIQAKYQYSINSENKEALSNVLKLKVIEPRGETRRYLNEYNDIISVYKTTDFNLFEKYIKDLLNKATDEGIRKIIYHTFAWVYPLKGYKEKIAENALHFITEYPKSYSAFFELQRNPKLYRVVIEDPIFKDTKLVEFAKNKLEARERFLKINNIKEEEQ